MRFKCNKCITFIWSLLLAFTSFLPGLIVLILVKPNNGVLDFNDLFIYYLLFFIFLIFINMTSFFFNSSVVEVYDEYFRYQESDLEYSKVFKIAYDFGETPRHAKWKSCSINFYDDYGDLIYFIDNPSIIMSLVLIKKCKNAKFKILFPTSYFFVMFIGVIIGLLHYFY